jgi:uncharacterized protein (TIGR02145 family)
MKIESHNSQIKRTVAILLLFWILSSQSTIGQVVIGGTDPDTSAVLDIQSLNKGVLLPRLSMSQRDAIISPATSLVIFNTTTNCLEVNLGKPASAEWVRIKCRTGNISSLNCSSASVTGLTIKIPYTDGNGGVYDSQSATSTGITGLTATLPAGNYADGSGSLSWLVSGAPTAPGIATFSLSSGGYSCSVPFTVVASGAISALDCADAAITGTLEAFVAASGVSASVPYKGANGAVYDAQSFTSTGVTGLTAVLNAGILASGAGAFTWSITGTPANSGTASFALSICGQSCTLNIPVLFPVCRAKISLTEYRDFMCHNLGAANTDADPFTPSWEINGGYWQWGRKQQAAAGPSGPGVSDADDGVADGWNTTNGSWSDGTKTANDPCPAGYRVPTRAQWDDVLSNNALTNVGSWISSSTNYSSGKMIGNILFLPAAGGRNGNSGGTLYGRGDFGRYWGSTEYGSDSDSAWYLRFDSGSALTYYLGRTYGFSIRCIAE